MSNINKIRLSGTTYDIEDLNAAKTVELTQAQYDALAVKDPNTFYIITDAEPVDMSDYYTKDEVDDELDGKADTATTYTKTEVDTALGAKQATLVSGTNIKTVNNESLLGSGNIEIQGGGGGATYSAGTNISIDTANTINCTLPITVNTNGSFKFGNNITSSLYNNEFLIGNSITSTAAHTAALGNNLQLSYNGETAIGRFNISRNGAPSGSTIFTVGNGSSQYAKHNAFEIRQNGDIYCSDGTNDVKLQDTITATAANTTALGGLKLVKLTQSEYDALATKDSNTLYVIVN